MQLRWTLMASFVSRPLGIIIAKICGMCCALIARNAKRANRSANDLPVKTIILAAYSGNLTRLRSDKHRSSG
jgi:hypothetical protein